MGHNLPWLTNCIKGSRKQDETTECMNERMKTWGVIKKDNNLFLLSMKWTMPWRLWNPILILRTVHLRRNLSNEFTQIKEPRFDNANVAKSSWGMHYIYMFLKMKSRTKTGLGCIEARLQRMLWQTKAHHSVFGERMIATEIIPPHESQFETIYWQSVCEAEIPNSFNHNLLDDCTFKLRKLCTP